MQILFRQIEDRDGPLSRGDFRSLFFSKHKRRPYAVRKVPPDAAPRRLFSAKAPISLINRAHAEARRRGLTFTALVVQALEDAVPARIVLGGEDKATTR